MSGEGDSLLQWSQEAGLDILQEETEDALQEQMKGTEGCSEVGRSEWLRGLMHGFRGYLVLVGMGLFLPILGDLIAAGIGEPSSFGSKILNYPAEIADPDNGLAFLALVWGDGKSFPFDVSQQG